MGNNKRTCDKKHPKVCYDIQIYILYLFLHRNYTIVYRNILLGVFYRMFSCCCTHHFPLYSQYGHFSFFSFDWSASSSFFCSLYGICFGISSGISIPPSGDGFSDSFVFLSFIFAVSSFFVFLFSFSFSFSFS